MTEFSAYPVIKSLVSKFTLKFLQLAGLLTKGKTLEVSKKRQKCTTSDPSRVSKYVQHSASGCTSTSTSSRADNFFSWWDDSQKKMFYIDPKTGNS